MLETSLNWKSDEFKELSENILSVINRPDNTVRIKELLEKYNSENKIDSITVSFINIICYLLSQDISALLSEYVKLRKLLSQDDIKDIPYLFSLIWLDVQLSLPKAQNPVSRDCFRNYKANINALKKRDPGLADLVQTSLIPDNFRIIDYWDSMHIFDTSSSQILKIPEDLQNTFDNLSEDCRPIVITSMFSGQEIIKCLQNRYDGIHGMSRAHYLLEEDSGKIRTLFELYDFSRFIKSEELIIFSGPEYVNLFAEKLKTGLYPTPVFIMGDDKLVSDVREDVSKCQDFDGLKSRLLGYYKSDEFKERQSRIVEGEVLPRVFISTCRWTTFLKYCAADFDKSFAALGCETRYQIEESETQRLLPFVQMKQVLDFKPDMIFMVSHARPSMNFMPDELPFVCYMQDRCGALEQEPRLDVCTERHDLFVCMLTGFRDFLQSKGIDPDQAFVYPVPADSEVFYPLATEKDNKYADISYVKHGSAEGHVLHKKYMADLEMSDLDADLKQVIVDFYNYLYDRFVNDMSICWSEADMRAVAEKTFIGMNENFKSWLFIDIFRYYVNVYSAIWRYQFIEELAKEGFDLALYGNGWENNSRLQKFAKGPIARDDNLNNVYNHSKINLSINHAVSMHQRLAECGLAGGFIMVADPGEQDWESARKYYVEDKEAVFFRTKEELVDKVRYYLEHEDERLEIADNMRRRALEERTCLKAAEVILEKFKRNVRRVMA